MRRLLGIGVFGLLILTGGIALPAGQAMAEVATAHARVEADASGPAAPGPTSKASAHGTSFRGLPSVFKGNPAPEVVTTSDRALALGRAYGALLLLLAPPAAFLGLVLLLHRRQRLALPTGSRS
jgi:hypothetical protein